MPVDPSAESRLQVYRLMEALQGEHEASAATELATLVKRADDAGWTEVGFLADLGLAMRGVIHPLTHADDTRAHLDRLVAEAERIAAPALLAHALALRAITAAAAEDTEGVLSDAGRALALLDRDDLPPLDACTALMVCGGAFNALALWELVDEIYDRAGDLSALCEEPLQAPAIAMNRVVVAIERATELLELDDLSHARALLTRARVAAETAGSVDRLPDDWRTAVSTCEAALTLYLEAPADPEQILDVIKGQQAALRAAGDVEMLPLSEMLVALAMLDAGRPGDALTQVTAVTEESASSGAHSFRLWLRLRALAAEQAETGSAVRAAFEYAGMLAEQRREGRQALLGAAHSRIAGERLRAERDRLFRDVAQDALTGLGNRRAFDSWLERDRVATTPTAMLLIDLDDFKTTNDRHGHGVGDEVLRQVGRAIAHHVRPWDLALRLGGDEFVVIIEARPEDASRTDSLDAVAHERAERIQQAIATVRWAEVAQELAVSASVGVAVRSLAAHDPGASTILYNDADRELYVAKRQRDPHRATRSG